MSCVRCLALLVVMIFWYPCNVYATGYCLAIRGNADRALSHYGAMSRIVENYGVPQKMAGASSASLAMMVMESSVRNPAVRKCFNKTCTEDDRVAKIAFLIKSVPWLMEDFWDSQAGFHAQQAQAYALKHLHTSNFFGQFAIFKHLREIFKSPLLKGVVNAEWFRVKPFWNHPGLHVQEFFKGIEKLTDFEKWDSSVYIRPGLIHWGRVVYNLGEYLDFLAGYGMNERLMNETAHVLNQCSQDSIGKNWYELKDRVIEVNGQTCEHAWKQLWAHWVKQRCPKRQRRIEEPVGKYIPALVGVGYLPGEDILTQYTKARKRFRRGKRYQFVPKIEDMKVGYWGPQDLLFEVAKNSENYDDEKTEKMVPLGELSWWEAARRSMSEPGLSRALPFAAGLTIGGWADLEPVQVLKNSGCDEVIYITRRGEASAGQRAILSTLGADDRVIDQWISLDQKSASTDAIELADAVWCADWESDFESTQNLYEDGWNAPVYLKNMDQPRDSHVPLASKAYRSCQKILR